MTIMKRDIPIDHKAIIKANINHIGVDISLIRFKAAIDAVDTAMA